MLLLLRQLRHVDRVWLLRLLLWVVGELNNHIDLFIQLVHNNYNNLQLCKQPYFMNCFSCDCCLSYAWISNSHYLSLFLLHWFKKKSQSAFSKYQALQHHKERWDLYYYWVSFSLTCFLCDESLHLASRVYAFYLSNSNRISYWNHCCYYLNYCLLSSHYHLCFEWVETMWLILYCSSTSNERGVRVLAYLKNLYYSRSQRTWFCSPDSYDYFSFFWEDSLKNDEVKRITFSFKEVNTYWERDTVWIWVFNSLI